ncbi:MAG TPA: hypothetical protein EYP35_02635 [Desulfobacterales bacterium]|nr:hypothetical protein [Desulfobacterales bacterium]HIP40509.1 hypothetical protein [Desulfocapsa sulfexigens]
MSHTYLIDLYALIDERLKDITKENCRGEPTENEIFFRKGRSEVLTEFKEFLTDNYSSKLPRRIRNRYSVK